MEPDVLTLAKPIAGGLPMGAILMSEEIAAAIQSGDHGTTFGGGPFVSSIALHVIGRIADPAFLEQVRASGEWLGSELRALSDRSGRIRAVRGIGYIWGVDVNEPAADIIARARDEGLLLVSAGNHTIRLLPPLVATRGDLAEGLGRFAAALG